MITSVCRRYRGCPEERQGLVGSGQGRGVTSNQYKVHVAENGAEEIQESHTVKGPKGNL